MATISDTRSSEDAGGSPPLDHDGDGPPPTDEAPPPTRTCDTCGAELEPGADWCLECGTAQPGRLGGRPGAKTLVAVTAITLLLFCGAISAGYAALTDDTSQQSSKPSAGSATPVPSLQADIPPASGAAGPTGAAAVPPVSGAAGPTSTTPKVPTLPRIPKSSAPVVPSTPNVPALPVTPAKPVTPSASPTGAASTPSTSTSSSTPTTSTPAVATPISLQPSDASVYDPYSRASAQGDPSAAIGTGSGWTVSTPADGKPMQVGLLINLGQRQAVSKLTFTTSTPGFRAEIYSTDGSATPSDILDTRWTHIGSRTKTKSSVSLKLHGDGEQTRQLVVWLTTPPAKPTVTISDLSVSG